MIFYQTLLNLLDISQTQVAFKYRFHARLGERLTRTLQYPPEVDGQEDYAVTTKNEENEYIRKILHVKPHPESPMFPDEYSLNGRPKGRIYEKLPFKFKVEEGKAYSLCTCGYSSNQVITVSEFIYSSLIVLCLAVL